MEILAERAIHTFNGYWFIAICFAVLVVVDMIIACICEDEFSTGSKVAICAAFVAMVFFAVLGANRSFTYPVMEYKVRFMEKIDMEEFLDTYKVIGKDGSIITIRCLEPRCLEPSAPSEETTN